ncbi:MAG TPA: esterase-like activity of phytase family protein, partial [Chitinophagaceae bacterium]
MRNPVIFIVCLLFLGSCHPSQKIAQTETPSISQLKFLDEYIVPNAKQFKETTIGGLSGIDYDAKRNVYYLISDDRSAVNPARFYTAKIYLDENKIDSVEFIEVKNLLQKDGTVYPNSKKDPYHTPDPEALRYDPTRNEFVWSSEGERIVKNGLTVLEDPSVIAIDRNGNYKDSFALPANMHMHATENGPRQNSVFEGLTFTGNDKYLFVSVEEPIYEDGPRADVNNSAWTRIIKFDTKTRMPVAQYAYQLEPVAHPASPPDSFKINGV